MLERLRQINRAGFTLVESLIYISIFVAVSLALLGMLVVLTRLQARQGSAAEVNQQSQFMLQTIQISVEQSNLVDLTTDLVTSTLKLRMTSSSIDPTWIYLSAGKIYLQQANGAPQALTSDKVNVTTLNFAKRANPPGKDVLAVAFIMSYNTSSSQQQFSRSLATTVELNSPALFDSDIKPSSTNVYALGAVAQDWQSINDTIFFGNGNTGVGTANPGQTLEVNGGVRLNTATAKPTCNSSRRGTLWLAELGSNTTDTLQICARDAASVYSWVLIIPP